MTVVGRRQPLLRRLAFLLAGLLLAAIAASAAVGAVYSDRVLPRTVVAGADLGGLSGSQARRRLETLLSPQRRLRVVGGARDLVLRAGEAGYRPDVEATLARARAAGRRSGPAGLVTPLLWIADPEPVRVAATVEPGSLGRITDAVARAAARRAFAGGLRVDAARRVSPVPPREGVAVDRRRFQRRLRQALLRRHAAVVEVPTRRVRVPPPAAVARVAAAATRYLRAPLRVAGGGITATVSPERVGRALTVAPAPDRRSARLAVSRAGRRAIVRAVARRVDRPVREAKIAAPARSATLEAKGDVRWRPRRVRLAIRRSVTGRTVRRDALARAIDAAVRSGSHTVRLPVRRVAPGLSTTAARRARFLIGTFTTRYEPGQPRVRNIQRIARAVDGTVVAPGARLSLNAITGRRTRAKGYVKAPFIADGKIVPSVGGGVSQFATTMYNAAYFAGLRLDAHQPHSLYIDRYPPGREATLNYPDIDLVWTNDTDAVVLVRTLSDATSVTVSLYGDNGGRRVRAQAGERRRIRGEDFEITVTREVRYAGGRSVRQPVTTRYDRPRDDP